MIDPVLPHELPSLHEAKQQVKRGTDRKAEEDPQRTAQDCRSVGWGFRLTPTPPLVNANLLSPRHNLPRGYGGAGVGGPGWISDRFLPLSGTLDQRFCRQTVFVLSGPLSAPTYRPPTSNLLHASTS